MTANHKSASQQLSPTSGNQHQKAGNGNDPISLRVRDEDSRRDRDMDSLSDMNCDSKV